MYMHAQRENQPVSTQIKYAIITTIEGVKLILVSARGVKYVKHCKLNVRLLNRWKHCR